MAKKTGTTAQAATSGINKQEAVRRALAALSKNATAKDIQKYIKDTFNLEMSIDHIYTSKSSALRKGKKKAPKQRTVNQPPAPEPTSAAKPPAQVVPVARQPAGGISLEDVEAVKGLLGRIGADNLKALVDMLAS
jgi:hypothetical protein